MKPIHIAAILGGAAAIYFVTRGGKAHAAVHQPTATDRWGKPITHKISYTLRANAPGVAGGCISSDGSLVPMSYCMSDASQGYFSTGALSADEYRTSYDHGHDHSVPCCSSCAQGRGCTG